MAAVEARGNEALEGFFGALSEDDAQGLYERAPCGYLSTTPDGTITKVNQTFLTWTGHRRHEVLGRRFADLLTPGGRIYHETHYAPMLRMQGRAREIALDIVAADGHRLPALVSAVLEQDEHGTPLVIRAAVFEATQRRQYERELLAAKQRAEASEANARLLSRTLQQMLVPPAPPRIAGLDVAGAYRPAGTGDEVGGDFYDVFERDEDDWVVAVGDVQGKGVDAAVVTALVRSTIRAAAVRHPRPSEVLGLVNDALLRNESTRFCTVGLLRLWLDRGNGDRGWTADVSSGGHPLPLLVGPAGQARDLGRPGPLLGVFGEASFSDDHQRLEPGEAVVLFTDGVTEGRRGEEWYGETRLAETIERVGPSATGLVQGILDDVLAFQSGFPRDDIAIVAVAVPGDDR